MAESSESEEHNNQLHALILDVYGNKRFSRDPVVLKPTSGSGSSSELSEAGVIVRFVPTKRQILAEETGAATGLYFYENPSILVAYYIKYDIYIITSNPRGLEL